jgi:hypothetical protein
MPVRRVVLVVLPILQNRFTSRAADRLVAIYLLFLVRLHQPLSYSEVLAVSMICEDPFALKHGPALRAYDGFIILLTAFVHRIWIL